MLLTLFTLNVNAQITLVHTFKDWVSWSGSYYFDQVTVSENVYSITNMTDSTYARTVYNSDYTLKSNETIKFPLPTGYILSSVSSTQKLFNTDDNFEYLVSYQKANYVSNDSTRCKLVLYDHNLNVIKDFGTAYYINTNSYLHIVNDSLRLLVTKEDVKNNYTTEVYYIGPKPSGLKSATVSLYPYPNPSNTTITLPYRLNNGEKSVIHIYSITGDLIQSIPVDSNSDKVVLDVSGFPRGTYIYEIKGLGTRFIVK